MRHRPPSEGSARLVRRAVLVALVTALSAGCATAERPSAKHEDRPAPASTLTRADDLLLHGQPVAARDLYVQLVAEPTRDAAHARALYNLARLYADPSGGLRDYRAAHLAFERLLREYPKGEWDADARAWHAVLGELAAREVDLAAREVELEARDGELGVREAEVARLKNETAKLGADLKRLKRIDLNVERRR